jgi:hypothetical protein
LDVVGTDHCFGGYAYASTPHLATYTNNTQANINGWFCFGLAVAVAVKSSHRCFRATASALGIGRVGGAKFNHGRGRTMVAGVTAVVERMSC